MGSRHLALMASQMIAAGSSSRWWISVWTFPKCGFFLRRQPADENTTATIDVISNIQQQLLQLDCVFSDRVVSSPPPSIEDRRGGTTHNSVANIKEKERRALPSL